MLPRLAFPFPTSTPSWFAGHMARSLRELPALLNEVDLVVEARDARLPLTSVNPAFDSVLERVWGHSGAGGRQDRHGKTKEKIVVYTKRDLAEERYETPLRKAFWDLAKQRVLFVDSRRDADVREVLRLSTRAARGQADVSTDLKVLVVGMPNVGKSSLLNALRRVGVRKGKAFITGAEPGVTRRLTGTVRIYDQPPIYVFDTPGVMVPYLGHSAVGAERGLKLALTAGIKGGLFEPEYVADYLLYKLNLRLAAEREGLAQYQHEPYTTHLPLPSSFSPTTLTDLLDTLAVRLGALRKGGERDTEASMAFFVRAFREGKLGRWTLDDLDGAEAALVAKYADVAEAGRIGQSQGGLGGVPLPHEDDGISGIDPLTFPSFSGLSPATSSAPSSEATVGTEELEQGASTSSPDSSPDAGPSSQDLQASVTRSVAAFLTTSAREKADADAGRNLSTNQRRKADAQEKAEARLARAKGKGWDKPRPNAGGYGKSKSRSRGRR